MPCKRRFHISRVASAGGVRTARKFRCGRARPGCSGLGLMRATVPVQLLEG